jgi:hypothetical protein
MCNVLAVWVKFDNEKAVKRFDKNTRFDQNSPKD